MAVCIALIATALSQSVMAQRMRTGVPTDSIRLSDPFILADTLTHTYYMTGTGGMLWTSKDLRTWDGPRRVVETDTATWMGRRPQIWAAEIHEFGGKYYYFATFTNNAVTIDNVDGRRVPRRACHVLVSDKPEGPYRPYGQPVFLPQHMATLDATLWIEEDGTPYMVYCHEWLQNNDGTVEAIKMTPNLDGTIGNGHILFRASDSPWSREADDDTTATHHRFFHRDGTGPYVVDSTVTTDKKGRPVVKRRWVPNRVTDGPFLFRTKTGKLGMIWTSWVGRDYTMGVAYSKSGTILGPWVQEPRPITPANYGHGMLFHDWRGRLLLCLHSHKDIRGHYVRTPHFFLMDDESDRLRVLANFQP